MQQNVGSPHIARNSYGFSMPEHVVRSPQNKGFLQPSHPFIPAQISHHDSLASSIKKQLPKVEIIESASHKKIVTTTENNPNLFGAYEAKFRPFYNNSELKVEETHDQFLRGSCSNVLRKFEQNQHSGINLRNTTHFNPINRFPISPTTPTSDSKRQIQQQNSFKLSNASKGISESIVTSVPFLMKPVQKRQKEAHSKTPNKIVGDKRHEQNTKSMSRTPIKYKNVFQNSKNSGIKTNNDEEKKTFKSLNQIIQSKSKEKMEIEKHLTRKYSKIVNGFQLGSILGTGKFGEVFLSRHRDTGFIAAIKKIVKSKVVEFKMVNQFCTEVRLHSCLDHPNIVKFHGCFDNKDDVYLVLEYMNGGTLFDYLNEVSCLPLRQTVEYLRDIIDAIVYMHQKSIAHRDIKPENIVISSQGVAKLCDFGWSAIVETSRKTYCGTFDYAPPEILQRKNYDTSVDIWCIGVLTYQLLTGRVPFQGEQRNIVMEKIVNVDKKKIQYPVNIPPEAKQFIEALVQKDPNLRPKCQDLSKFKLFTMFPRMGSKPAPINPPKKSI